MHIPMYIYIYIYIEIEQSPCKVSFIFFFPDSKQALPLGRAEQTSQMSSKRLGSTPGKMFTARWICGHVVRVMMTDLQTSHHVAISESSIMLLAVSQQICACQAGRRPIYWAPITIYDYIYLHVYMYILIFTNVHVYIGLRRKSRD